MAAPWSDPGYRRPPGLYALRAGGHLQDGRLDLVDPPAIAEDGLDLLQGMLARPAAHVEDPAPESARFGQLGQGRLGTPDLPGRGAVVGGIEEAGVEV
jgi:hypothetical protein